MQKEIIAAIAAYLEENTHTVTTNYGRFREFLLDWKVPVNEIATEIAAAIAPLVQALQPSAEDVKRWHALLVGMGEKAMKDDMAVAFAPLVEAGVNKNIEEAKMIVVKVAASLVRDQACEYAEDLNLPKTTPITAIRKFEHEARVWNDTNRLRAIELKRAYDLMK